MPETARDLGTVVHLVDQTQTIVPGHENAYYTLTVPTEAVAGAGDEIIGFSAGFEATEGPGLQMEVLDSDRNRLAAGERFRVRAAQGEELLLHVFGVEAQDGTRGAGAYTLAIDVLPQVVSVEAQSLLPGIGLRPGGPTTSLVITLQGDRLDLTTAEYPNHYTVTHLGPDAAPGIADDRVIPIGGAGIEQPIVYNPGANVEVSTGLTYPTAVRQTVTLLFAEQLPAGSYMIELSSAIQTAAFNEMEQELLADPGNFTGHPVVSFGGGQITEGARVDAIDSVLQTGRLGDLGAFEAGTAFLTQLQNDLGALLDAVLSEIGDDPSVTDLILDQILDRLGPGLGEFGQRATELLVIFLDPVSFSLRDPGGNRAIFDLQTGTLVSNIPSTSVEVWGNVELVVVPITPVTFGTYELHIADVPSRARGGEILLGSAGNEVYQLTADIRSGIDHFTFTVGSMLGSMPLLPPQWVTPRAAEIAGTPSWHGALLSNVASSGDQVDLATNSQRPRVSLNQSLEGGSNQQPDRERVEFDEYDVDNDGRWSFGEFSTWATLKGIEAEVAEEIFKLADRNRDGWLDYEESKLMRKLISQRTDKVDARTEEVDGSLVESTDGEPVTLAVDNVDEEPVSRGRSDSAGAKQNPLPALTVARAFDAVHADAVPLGSATDDEHPATFGLDPARAANIGDDAHQPTPKGLLANLTELFGFVWNLLAMGMGG